MNVADTPESIDTLRLLTIRSGLKLEIKTGLRHSRNAVLRAAQNITGKTTRAACLAAIEKKLAKLAESK